MQSTDTILMIEASIGFNAQTAVNNYFQVK
jgi:hypothetical protein